MALRFRALFRRLGPGLDGPGTFADADVWYCILEGTAEIAVAEAQARALVDLLASYVGTARAGTRTSPARGGRVQRGVPAAADLAAVRAGPLARPGGPGVRAVLAGLADDEDERYRIAASADGGIWLLRTPYPDPVVALAGNRDAIDTTRRLLGAPLWSDEGSLPGPGPPPVLDGDIVRALDVGQAAYVYRGGVTFVQVKRLVAAPAALPAGRPAPGARPAWPAALGRRARRRRARPRRVRPRPGWSRLDRAKRCSPTPGAARRGVRPGVAMTTDPFARARAAGPAGPDRRRRPGRLAADRRGDPPGSRRRR